MASYNSCGYSPSSQPTLPYYNARPGDLKSTCSFYAGQLSPQMGGPAVTSCPTTQHSDPSVYNFESWAEELKQGAEVEAAILARDGYACLYRPEYQFTDSTFSNGTAYSPQKANISPSAMLSPLYSDSPGSTSSQDGSVMSAEAHMSYKSINPGPQKRFKCDYPDCDYASSRRDHLTSHFKAHHEGNPFVCSQCHKTYVFPGDLHSHAPCNTHGKELCTTCTHCGSSVNKKGLKRHQGTPKCRNNQIARQID